MTLGAKAHLYIALWQHLGAPMSHRLQRADRKAAFTSRVPLLVDRPWDDRLKIFPAQVHAPELPATAGPQDVEMQVVTKPAPVQAPAPPATSAPAPVPISLPAILRQAPHLQTGTVRVSTGKVTAARRRAAKRAEAKPYDRPAGEILVNTSAPYSNGTFGPIIDSEYVPPMLDIEMFNANPSNVDLIVLDNSDINMPVLDPDQPHPAIDLLLAELRTMAPAEVADAPAPPKPFSDEEPAPLNPFSNEELASYLLSLIQQNGDQAAIPHAAVAQSTAPDFLDNFGITPAALHV